MFYRSAVVSLLILVFLNVIRNGTPTFRCKTIVKNIFIDSCRSTVKRDSRSYQHENNTADVITLVSRVRSRRESSTILKIPSVSTVPEIVYRISRHPTTPLPLPLSNLDTLGLHKFSMFDLDKSFLPQETASGLGFELSEGEIDELYNEIYERIGRSPWNKDARPEIFECCKDVESCRRYAEKSCPA